MKKYIKASKSVKFVIETVPAGDILAVFDDWVEVESYLKHHAEIVEKIRNKEIIITGY